MGRSWIAVLAPSLIGLWGCASAQAPPQATPTQALESYVRCLERGDHLAAAEHLVDDGRYGEDRLAIAARLRRAGPEALDEARQLLEASRRPEAVRTIKSRR